MARLLWPRGDDQLTPQKALVSLSPLIILITFAGFSLEYALVQSNINQAVGLIIALNLTLVYLFLRGGSHLGQHLLAQLSHYRFSHSAIIGRTIIGYLAACLILILPVEMILNQFGLSSTEAIINMIVYGQWQSTTLILQCLLAALIAWPITSWLVYRNAAREPVIKDDNKTVVASLRYPSSTTEPQTFTPRQTVIDLSAKIGREAD